MPLKPINMSALQNFMLTVDRDKQNAIEIAEKTAQDIESQQTTLIDVVQSLGEYVNDDDAIIRGKVLSYLAAVVKAFSPKFLSRHEIHVLTTFFCDRIQDGGAVTGLDALQKLDRFTKEFARESARAIFRHSRELQARAQSQRYQVYQLVNGLMENHREALHEMGDESLVGLVDLMTGEKDPRNLMLVFSILKVVMVEWDITGHIETLFDSVYNYFPITFRPPPNDPYGITAQDLKDRLQACISSNSLFAPHAFPALIDKLDSTSNNVKRDSLNALIACIESYDANTVSRYSIKIWDAVKFEILNAQEEFLSEMSLNVLRTIVKRLSEHTTQVSNDMPLAHFLNPIIQECNDQLREPQNKQAQPARAILRAVSSASTPSFILIIQSVVAPLFTIYQEADSIAKQRAFLETYVTLLDSAIDLYGTWSDRDSSVPQFENPLSAFQDQFTEVFSQALMGSAKEEISFRQTALQGLLRLSKIRNFFQDNEIGMFVQYLDEILLKEEVVGSGAPLKKDAVAALAELSRYKPNIIMEITLPAFMATLPDQDDGTDLKYITTLDNLAQISAQRNIFETLVRRLLNKLDLLLQEDSSHPRYARVILLTMIHAANKKPNDPGQSLDSYYDRIVVGLSKRAALASTSNTSKILRDVSVLDTLGKLCTLIVRSVSREKQDEVAENIYTLYSNSDDDHHHFKPVPFSQTQSESQKRTMILSTALLAGLPKDTTKLPYTTTPDITPLLNELVQLSETSASDPAVQLAIHRHLALLVNKFLPNSALPLAFDFFNANYPSSSPEITTKTTAAAATSPERVKTLFWLSKALALRLAPSTSSILSSLLLLLSSPDRTTSSTAAKGFALILSPDEVLSPENGANIRLLCKQRVFNIVVPMITTKFRELSPSSSPSSPSSSSLMTSHIKPAYLTALSGILSSIPTDLVLPELPNLLPLLLQSLDLTPSSVEDTSTTITAVKTATLRTLAVLIRDNGGVHIIHETGHIQDLVRRLLKTAHYCKEDPSSSSSSAALREQALRCLYLLAISQVPPSPPTTTTGAGGADVDAALAAALSRPTGSTTTTTAPTKTGLSPLLPVKNQVLRALMQILDDPKRDVRKAAVDARGAWLRAVVSDDGPDEDDD